MQTHCRQWHPMRRALSRAQVHCQLLGAVYPCAPLGFFCCALRLALSEQLWRLLPLKGQRSWWAGLGVPSGAISVALDALARTLCPPDHSLDI